MSSEMTVSLRPRNSVGAARNVCADTSKTVYVCRVLRDFATFIQSDGIILDYKREKSMKPGHGSLFCLTVSAFFKRLCLSPTRCQESAFPMIAKPLVVPTILVRSFHFNLQAFERWRRARQESSMSFVSGHWLMRLGFQFQMDRADACDAWTLGYT